MHRKMMHGQYCLFNNSNFSSENNSNHTDLLQNNISNTCQEIVLHNDGHLLQKKK